MSTTREAYLNLTDSAWAIAETFGHDGDWITSEQLEALVEATEKARETENVDQAFLYIFGACLRTGLSVKSFDRERLIRAIAGEF